MTFFFFVVYWLIISHITLFILSLLVVDVANIIIIIFIILFILTRNFFQKLVPSDLIPEDLFGGTTRLCDIFWPGPPQSLFQGTGGDYSLTGWNQNRWRFLGGCGGWWWSWWLRWLWFLNGFLNLEMKDTTPFNSLLPPNVFTTVVADTILYFLDPALTIVVPNWRGGIRRIGWLLFDVLSLTQTPIAGSIRLFLGVQIAAVSAKL